MSRSESLCARFQQSAAAFLADRTFGLPPWARDDSPPAAPAPVVVCGTGHWAVAFLAAVRDRVEVLGVVDDAHAGRHAHGLPCLSTGSLVELVRRRPEIVCLNTGQSHAGYGHFAALQREDGLRMLTYAQAVRYYGLAVDVRVADWAPEIAQRAAEFVTLAPLFADELSRETLFSVLLLHLEAERAWVSGVARPGDATYFHTGVYELHEQETYVDCGAYDGDSVRAFLHATAGRCAHVHAFEADPANFARLERWLASQGERSWGRKISLHQAAVGESAGTLVFDNTGGEGACIPREGAEGAPGVGGAHGLTVPCVRLDEAVPEPITLLKLDVEGHERAVLKGAAGHLQRSQPKLAVCAYHLPDDLLALPRQILEQQPAYTLALRHHNYSRYDTILYAS